MIATLFTVAIVSFALMVVSLAAWIIWLWRQDSEPRHRHESGRHTWPTFQAPAETRLAAAKHALRRHVAAMNDAVYQAEYAAAMSEGPGTVASGSSDAPASEPRATNVISAAPAPSSPVVELHHERNGMRPVAYYTGRTDGQKQLLWRAVDDLPHLQRDWQDDTGTFTALAGLAS